MLSKYFDGQLEAILDACSEGIYIADNNGIGLSVNKSYERITGISSENLLGKNMADVVAQGIVSDSVTLKVIAKKETITITQKINGEKEVLVTGRPLFDSNGNIKLVVTTVRDMTELNNLHNQIKIMNEKNEQFFNELLLLRKYQLDSEEFTFTSKAMSNVIDIVCNVSQFDTTCLLLGESGVGKDVIARLIHSKSPRNNMPFIKINCGAIPSNLLEAELFGYNSGAFTGARKEGKSGMFELAHTGTLFLDEIGELPLDLQVKLLQAVQDKAVYRLGGTKPIKVDVRIITATNRNLEQMVKTGEFRSDLYYRLNIIPIEIPPLRERTEDIIPIAESVLKHLNEKYGKTKQLTPEVINCFINYSWPGNIRELKNIIERLYVVDSNELISLTYLPKKYWKNSKPILNNSKTKLQEAIQELEIHLLKEAMSKYNSLTKVAEELGINKSTVSRKLQLYNLDKK
ncbi:MAG: sigma-54 interaction domain-containing protein [Bacillota bacterium]